MVKEVDLDIYNEVLEELRGWKKVIFKLIYIDLKNHVFELSDVYEYEEYLKSIFFDNNNILPKIRQILQQLRDLGYVRFMQEQGTYSKVDKFFKSQNNNNKQLTEESITNIDNKEENLYHILNHQVEKNNNPDQSFLYNLEDIFEDDLAFVEYLKNKDINIINKMSAKDIFDYYKTTNLEGIISNANKYITARYKCQKLEYLPLTFEDYYVMIYQLEKIGWHKNRIYHKNNKLIKTLSNYSNHIDYEKLESLIDLKMKLLSGFNIDDKSFFNQMFVLKEYYEISVFDLKKPKETKNTVDYKEPILDKTPRFTSDITKKEIKTEKRSPKVEENRKPNDIEIYEALIKGYIDFGIDFISLVDNIDNYRKTLETAFGIKHSNNTSSKLTRRHKIFIRFNYSSIKAFEEKSLNAVEFSNCCILNKKKFYQAITKKTSLSRLYEVFIQTSTLFDYKESNFSISHLSNLYKYYGIDDSFFIDSDNLQRYWAIYLECNKKILFNVNINRIELDKNRKNFIELSIFSNDRLKTFNKLEKILVDNYSNFIVNLIIDKQMQDILDNYSIETFEDLSNLTKVEFMELVYNKTILYKLTNIINIGVESIKETLSKQLGTYINDKLTDREHYVLENRAKGITLEMIGKKLEVTRERVRQIEGKAIRKYKSFIRSKPYIFDMLKSFTELGTHITLSDLELIYGDNLNLFLYFNSKYYNKTLEVLEFKDLSTINQIVKRELSSRKERYIHVSDLDQLVNDIITIVKFNSEIISSSKYVRLAILALVHKEGDYIFYKRPTLVDKYEVILKNHFYEHIGISMSNVDLFKDKYYEVYGDESIYQKKNRAVLFRAIDNSNVIQVDRGFHAVKEEISSIISADKLDKIYTFIINSEKVNIEALFIKFKSIIYPDIKNKYELHGILRNGYKDLYFTKDVVGTVPNPSINTTKIILKYIHQQKGILDTKKMIKDLPELAGIHYEFQISQIDGLVGMFKSKYIHSDYLMFNEKEMSLVKEEVRRRLQSGMIVKSKMIYDVMAGLAPEILRQNHIDNIHYAYNYFAYYYKDDFNYESNHVNLLGENMTIISLKTFTEEYLAKDMFRLSTVRSTANDKGILIHSVKDFTDAMYEEGFMRIDEDIVVRKSLVINDNALRIMREVNEKLLYILNQGRDIDLDNLNLEMLPQLNKPWNKHLLAHMLIVMSENIDVEIIGRQYNDLQYILRKKEIV